MRVFGVYDMLEGDVAVAAVWLFFMGKLRKRRGNATPPHAIMGLFGSNLTFFSVAH